MLHPVLSDVVQEDVGELGKFNGGPWRRSGDCSAGPGRRRWGIGLVQPGENVLVGLNSSFPTYKQVTEKTKPDILECTLWECENVRDINKSRESLQLI